MVWICWPTKRAPQKIYSENTSMKTVYYLYVESFCY